MEWCVGFLQIQSVAPCVCHCSKSCSWLSVTNFPNKHALWFNLDVWPSCCCWRTDLIVAVLFIIKLLADSEHCASLHRVGLLADCIINYDVWLCRMAQCNVEHDESLVVDDDVLYHNFTRMNYSSHGSCVTVTLWLVTVREKSDWILFTSNSENQKIRQNT